MEKNTQTGGFWMLVEEISHESLQEDNRSAAEKKEILDDDFFPDTSF